MSLTPLSADPAGGPVRNVRDPYAHRLQVSIDLSAGTGTALPNLGLLNARNASAAFAASLTKTGTGSEHWQTDADGTPYLDLSNRAPPTQGRIGIINTAETFVRGCIVMRLRVTNPSDALTPIFTGGVATGTVGGIRFMRMANASNNTLRIQLRATAGQKSIDTDPTVDVFSWADWMYLRVEWGETGYRVWVNDFAVKDSGGLVTDPVITDGVNECRINAQAVSATLGETEFSHFYWWDTPIDDHYWEQLKADIALPLRPSPSAILDCPAGAVSTRVTGTTATLATVSDAALGATTPVYARAKYGTTPSALSSTSATATGTGPYAQMLIELTGLTAGTEYFYALEYSDDNATWFKARGGANRFVTMRIAADDAFRFIIAADPHDRTDNGGPASVEDSGYGTDIEFLTPQPAAAADGRKVMTHWHSAEDIRRLSARPDFGIMLGDFHHPDGVTIVDEATDENAMRLRAALHREAYQLAYGACGWFWTIGNHEGEAGYQQNADQTTATPMQKIATRTRKTYFPNPTDGEVGSEADWIPPLDSTYDTAYRAAHTDDADGINASPLENYYSFETGNALFVVLDPYRYSAPGDPANAVGAGGAHSRPIKEWTLGSTQRAWLATTLRESTAGWKFVFCHQWLGGKAIGQTSADDLYGRASGANLDDGSADAHTGEDSALHNIYRQTGVTAVFFGHDHKFSDVLKETVRYIHVPTIGANSLAGNLTDNRGWVDETGPVLWTEMDADYGDPELLGSDKAGVGMQNYYNVVGYLVVDVAAGAVTIRLRQTSYNFDDIAAGVYPAQFGERYAGPIVASDATGIVTVSEAPRWVAAAFTDAAIAAAGDWWDTPPTDLKPTLIGDHDYDAHWAVTLDLDSPAADSTNCRVLCGPRELLNFALTTNASYPAGTLADNAYTKRMGYYG